MPAKSLKPFDYRNFKHVVVNSKEYMSSPAFPYISCKAQLCHIKKINKGENFIFPNMGPDDLALIIPLKSGNLLVAHIGRDDFGNENEDKALIKSKDNILCEISDEIPLQMRCIGDESWHKTQDQYGNINSGLFSLHLELEALAQKNDPGFDDDYYPRPDTTQLKSNFKLCDIIGDEEGSITISALRDDHGEESDLEKSDPIEESKCDAGELGTPKSLSS